MAAGGKAIAQTMSESDWRIAQTLAPILWQRGILLAGLDVIWRLPDRNQRHQPDRVPKRIYNQTGFDVAGLFIETLEHAVK